MPLILSSDDAGKLLLRLMVGGMMLLHGIDKVTGGIASIEGSLASRGLPTFIAYGVYLGEVVAPALILLGYKSRAAAAVLSFNMAVAIFLKHSDDLFRLGKNGQWAVELQMFYLLGAIAIVLFGAGRYSLSKGRGALD